MGFKRGTDKMKKLLFIIGILLLVVCLWSTTHSGSVGTGVTMSGVSSSASSGFLEDENGEYYVDENGEKY